MYIVSRYRFAKKEWIKWKKMLALVSKSDMRMDTMLRLVVYKIFEEGGLWDQGHAFEKSELMALKAALKQKKFYEMNMKVPENCSNETCQHVKDWVSARGVSDDAANLKNFRVQNADNATLKDIDANLDVFEDYEKAIDNKENEAKATEMAKAVIMALEGDLSLLMKLLNGTNPFGRRRMLADDDVVLEEVDDNTAGALDAGQDSQLDETELDDVTEIDQTEPTEQLEAIDNVSEADAGNIGDDSNTDDFPSEGGDSGTSFMTWVMYIGGAILVMALLAGTCYLLTQRKDADNFQHEQQNTEMTMGHHDHA